MYVCISRESRKVGEEARILNVKGEKGDSA
jgi:hypothetical protein